MSRKQETTRHPLITQDYSIDSPIHIKFLENPKFSSKLKVYLQELFPVQIEIKQSNIDDKQQTYKIQVSSQSTEQIQTCLTEFKALFSSIQTQIYADRKVESILKHHPNAVYITQRILNHKKEYAVCQFLDKHQYEVYYFQFKKPFYTEDIEKIIQENVVKEILDIPTTVSVQTKNFSNELKNMIKQDQENYSGETMISISLIDSVYDYRKIQQDKEQQQLNIFGYYKNVNELKQKYQDFFNQHELTVFKIQMNPIQINYLLYVCSKEVKEIEKNYKMDNVRLRIKSQEFQAPLKLKDEINQRINDLVSKMKNGKFKTIELFQAVIEREIQCVKNIAHRNQCHVDKYELTTNISQISTVPMASGSKTANQTSSKLLREQSNLLCSSLDVITKATLTNGSICVFNGDITRAKVDIIVVPWMSNGLRESIIEQAGLDVNSLKSNPNQQNLSIKFIEANSDKLLCKTILFSNWTPTIADDDNDVRKSIQRFISKSIQYAVTRLKAGSIAFAVPSVYDKEEILAETMISATKQQIEKSPTLIVSFVLLSDQQILFEKFSAKLGNKQNLLQFSLPIATIKIYLLASSDESLRKCRENINKYLKRCVIKEELQNKNSTRIFKQWDQFMINAFYYYCKTRCVLPMQIENNNQILELSGPEKGIQEVKQKYELLDALHKQKAETQITLRSSSPTRRRPLTDNNAVTTESVNTTATTCYNIMLTYCAKDQSRCQRLADRLVDDDFSVLIIEASTVSTKHDKCDCVIVCLSEHSQEIEKNLKNIINTSGTKVVLVKIQYFNTLISGWLHQYMIGKFCHYLYGSDDYFNLEYDKLMLTVLKTTKPGYVSLLQPKANRSDELQQYNQYIERQRKDVYNERVKELIELGKISDDDMKNLIEKLPSLVEEEEDESEPEKTKVTEKRKTKKRSVYIDIEAGIKRILLIYQRWIKKSPSISKQNIPPFTLTGDINDAVFPIPDDIRKNREYILTCLVKYWGLRMAPCLSRWMGGYWGTSFGPYGKIPVKQLQLANRTFGIPSAQISQSIDQSSQLRKFSRSTIIKQKHVWEHIDFIGVQTKTDKEMKKREKLDNDYSIMQELREIKTKYFMDKYPKKQDQISRSFNTFMEQKRKNMIKFDKLGDPSTS